MYKNNTDLNIENLFAKSNNLEAIELDIDVPQAQEVKITSVDGFQIDTMSAIQEFRSRIVFNYIGNLILFRGHESKDYKIESTIVRLSKQDNGCSPQDIVNAESKGYKMFCHEVFNDDWLRYKLNSIDEDMFRLSIGRHLGLPCRLIDVTAKLDTAIWFAVKNPEFYNQDGEIILIVLNRDEFSDKSRSPFNVTKMSYSHEIFGAVDSLHDLPLGEQRRFIQNGQFIWVDNNSLLNEQQIIEDSAIAVKHFTIPRDAKKSLANELKRDVFKDSANHPHESDMERIKKYIVEVLCPNKRL